MIARLSMNGDRADLDPGLGVTLTQRSRLLDVIEHVSALGVFQQHVNLGFVLEIAVHSDDVRVLQLRPYLQFPGEKLLLEVLGSLGSVDDLESVLLDNRGAANPDCDFDLGVTTRSNRILAGKALVCQDGLVRNSQRHDRGGSIPAGLHCERKM